MTNSFENQLRQYRRRSSVRFGKQPTARSNGNSNTNSVGSERQTSGTIGSGPSRIRQREKSNTNSVGSGPSRRRQKTEQPPRRAKRPPRKYPVFSLGTKTTQKYRKTKPRKPRKPKKSIKPKSEEKKPDCMICLNEIKNNGIYCKHNSRRAHGICRGCNVNTNALRKCPMCDQNNWRVNKNGNPISVPIGRQVRSNNNINGRIAQMYQEAVNAENNGFLNDIQRFYQYNSNSGNSYYSNNFNPRCNWNTIQSKNRLNLPSVVANLNNVNNDTFVHYYLTLTPNQQEILYNYLINHQHQTRASRVLNRYRNLF